MSDDGDLMAGRYRSTSRITAGGIITYQPEGSS